MENATWEVEKTVRSQVDNVKASLVGSKYQWVAENLKFSSEMLFYAANHLPVGSYRLLQYRLCWVATEGITYIQAGDTGESETFQLRVNFPPIVKHLKDMLISHGYSDRCTYNAILDGFRFEYAILDHATSLSIVRVKTVQAQ